MILTKMTAVGTDGSRVMLWFDDGSRMKLSTDVVVRQGLYQGMDISEEALGELQEAAQRASAKDRAVRIVSATSISEKELKRRLVQRGERPEDAVEAVDWLKELGAVNDEAMAKRVVLRCVEKGYGTSRIRQELYQKGIPKEYWEEALSAVPDMGNAIDAFLKKRLRGRDPDQKELQRVTAALQRRGHSWGDIRAALLRYQADLELGDDGWDGA